MGSVVCSIALIFAVFPATTVCLNEDTLEKALDVATDVEKKEVDLSTTDRETREEALWQVIDITVIKMEVGNVYRQDWGIKLTWFLDVIRFCRNDNTNLLYVLQIITPCAICFFSFILKILIKP